MDSQHELRNEQRISTSKLGVAIQHSNLVLFNQLHHSQLIDICHGGVSLANKVLKLKIGKKINLFFYYNNETYSVKGLVVRCNEKQGTYIYGIMFVDAPIELDKIIDNFLQNDQEYSHNNIAARNSHQRKAGDRIPLRDSQIFVKRMEHPDDIQDGLQTIEMIEANVVNISKGGIAFVCEQLLSKSTPFHVQLRISNLDSSMQITGLVHHIEKRADNYFYGVEFKMVPMEFVRLLDELF